MEQVYWDDAMVIGRASIPAFRLDFCSNPTSGFHRPIVHAHA